MDKETIPETAKNIVLYHHEKWDGSGYPHQLKNNEIPIEAQIVAMADVYDALRSRRIYKPPYSAEHAEKIIIENAETHFNPDLVRIFIRVKGEFATIMETYKEAIE